VPALVLLAAAPQAASAQGWSETQLWAVGLAARPAVVGAGLGLASRDAGRTRLGAAIAAGATEHGGAALRIEATWHFMLDPGRTRGLGVYGGGGVALTAVQDSTVRPFLQVVLGVETGPAARAGFFLEAGFGGGARVAMGVRFRRPKQNAPGG